MEKLEGIIQYSKEILGNDRTGHDFEHAKRVASWVNKIIHDDQLQLNEFVALAAAYLHDTIDDKVIEDVSIARKNLTDFLNDFLTKNEVEAIFRIIDTISFSANLEVRQELSEEAKVVQDGDRIDALGAHGILRTAYYGGLHGHPIHDEGIPLVNYKDKSSYRKGSTVINHFYEKLFLLPDMMHTHTAKLEANRRLQFMKDFIDEFYQEMSM